MIKTYEDWQKATAEKIPIVYQSDYISIGQRERIGLKTKMFIVFDQAGYAIAEIKWHAPWRKYCFFPYENTLWDNKCLNQIINFINVQMEKRKGEKD